MPAAANMNGIARAFWVLLGIALALWGAYGADAAWSRILLLALGAYLLIEGFIGFSLLFWLFGSRGQSS